MQVNWEIHQSQFMNKCTFTSGATDLPLIHREQKANVNARKCKGDKNKVQTNPTPKEIGDILNAMHDVMIFKYIVACAALILPPREIRTLCLLFSFS
jgi:hypothetical protein